jgi:hypothetical protein
MKKRNILLKMRYIFVVSILTAAASFGVFAQKTPVEVASLAELARVAAESGKEIKMARGVYKMSDFFTDEKAAEFKRGFKPVEGRQPVFMLEFSGSNNRFDLRDVIIEIDTSLYAKLPPGEYVRCIFISGNNNQFNGLTIRNSGDVNKGSNGNILSVFGDGNLLENISVYVTGSFPYGYGDLFGKGGPNISPLQKQSGVMIAGSDTTLRRCKVISRAFGHCFYIQGGVNTRFEDCYAEGTMRPTSDMLRETSGTAFDLNFRSVYINRDGRFSITPGYMKSLTEDGFRTYLTGGPKNRKTEKTVFINCTAINTRAGFEISGSEDQTDKTILDGAQAFGTERGFLIGPNVIVRNSRGDVKYGPLLYLRGGHDSDIELEVVGESSDYTVHALATIAGENHRVRFYTNETNRVIPSYPIMLGFAMPDHAEMSSAIKPLATKNVTLINEITRVPIIKSELLTEEKVESKGLVLADADSKKLPSGARGRW